MLGVGHSMLSKTDMVSFFMRLATRKENSNYLQKDTLFTLFTKLTFLQKDKYHSTSEKNIGSI